IGVGAGLILDSKLYEGRFNSAGEIFNHIDPAKLNSGLNLEKSIFLESLIKKSQESIKKKSTSPYTEEMSDFEGVVKAYQDNNPYLLKHLDDIGMELGCTISNIANLLSIDTVIIGGEYIVFYQNFFERISKIVKEHCIFTPEIRPSALGRYAGIMGLFAISREHYFDSLIQSI
ncbi:MAG: ROK family protein, partial [Eubacteriales bacterium]|nr:ROK family protein [Eubacteriales bacterium]